MKKNILLEMEDEKTIIKPEYFETLKEMFLSDEKSVCAMANSILNNRDTTNEESEANYKEFFQSIIGDSFLKFSEKTTTHEKILLHL